MQIPTQYTIIYIEKGTDFSVDITIVDQNGNISINEESVFIASIKESYFSDDPVYFNVSNAAIEEGILTLSLPRAVTSNLSRYNHIFDLYVHDEHDKVEKLLYGIAKVYP